MLRPEATNREGTHWQPRLDDGIAYRFTTERRIWGNLAIAPADLFRITDTSVAPTGDTAGFGSRQIRFPGLCHVESVRPSPGQSGDERAQERLHGMRQLAVAHDLDLDAALEARAGAHRDTNEFAETHRSLHRQRRH